MQGIVNQSCEATLPIVIKNNATTQLVETVIDLSTGQKVAKG
jgi:hypothetical protein